MNELKGLSNTFLHNIPIITQGNKTNYKDLKKVMRVVVFSACKIYMWYVKCNEISCDREIVPLMSIKYLLNLYPPPHPMPLPLVPPPITPS